MVMEQDCIHVLSTFSAPNFQVVMFNVRSLLPREKAFMKEVETSHLHFIASRCAERVEGKNKVWTLELSGYGVFGSVFSCYFPLWLKGLTFGC